MLLHRGQLSSVARAVLLVQPACICIACRNNRDAQLAHTLERSLRLGERPHHTFSAGDCLKIGMIRPGTSNLKVASRLLLFRRTDLLLLLDINHAAAQAAAALQQ
jgi:hypothetical protein